MNANINHYPSAVDFNRESNLVSIVHSNIIHNDWADRVIFLNFHFINTL